MVILTALLSTVCIAAGIYLAVKRNKKRRIPFPPGPPPLPIIGNLLDVPIERVWVAFNAMSKKYDSDILYLNALGNSIVVLNSFEVVNDLLDKRSSIYSGRAHSIMLCDLMGWGWFVALLPYGDKWRAQRRLFHQEFSNTAIRRFYPQQVKSSRDVLKRLLTSPGLWQKHFRHQAGALIMNITYGLDVLPENDPHIAIAEASLEGTTAAAVPGAFLVDFFPVLKYVPSWVPGAGFQRKAIKWKRVAEMVQHVPYQAMKEALDKGESRPSFASSCLQNITTDRSRTEQEQDIRDTAAAMYVAGADTTVNSLSYFALAMTMHPDVQAKVQEELDRVLGPYQLPTFEDRDALPYLTATLKEIQRFHVIGPIGIPHALDTDDEYRGYHLPAGSVILPNTWAILHDGETYPEPFSFKPERFLKDGKIDPSVLDPDRAAFGYGRRMCPGQNMALASVWITAGSVLSRFNIDKAIGPDGEPVEVSGKGTAGLVTSPEPFECRITPRSEEAERLVRMIMEE